MAKGLRTFVLDPKKNPGRTNLFSLDRRLLVLDYAHNEAGMDGLVEILQGLRPPGREIWLAIGTAGDRTDEILQGFAVRAALGADHLAIAELLKYLRGRPREDVVEQLRRGAARAGKHDVPVYHGRDASPPGDAQGVRARRRRGDHGARPARAGVPVAPQPRSAKLLGPSDVRRLVKAARSARRSA